METSRILFAIVIIVALRLIANKFQKSWASTNSPEKDVCADPPSIPSRDPIFGLDTVFQIFQQVKEHRRMRSTHGMIRRYGHTYQSFPFGSRTVTTIHPQNLQKIFTEIDTFGVAAQRERATEPMLGRGIVSSDGLVWADARAMIKPTFSKSQIADSRMFSAHVDQFMQLLPRDNSEVDLQPLFDRLVRCSIVPKKMLSALTIFIDPGREFRVYIRCELQLPEARLSGRFAKVSGILQLRAARSGEEGDAGQDEVSDA